MCKVKIVCLRVGLFGSPTIELGSVQLTYIWVTIKMVSEQWICQYHHTKIGLVDSCEALEIHT